MTKPVTHAEYAAAMSRHADILERAHGLPAKRQRPMLAEADRLLVVIRAYHAQAAVLEAAQIRHQAAVA